MPLDSIKAAFALLYDVSLAGRHTSLLADLDGSFDVLRRAISLSRKEAQFILRQPEPRPSDYILAAFVLIYEGYSMSRVENDFTFSADDLLLLATARKSIRLSTRRAVTILSTARNEALSPITSS